MKSLGTFCAKANLLLWSQTQILHHNLRINTYKVHVRSKVNLPVPSQMLQGGHSKETLQRKWCSWGKDRLNLCETAIKWWWELHTISLWYTYSQRNAQYYTNDKTLLQTAEHVAKNDQFPQLQVHGKVCQHTTQKCQISIELLVTVVIHRQSTDLHTHTVTLNEQ